MFTNRFIKVPVDLYNTKKAQIIGYNEGTKETDTVMFVYPFEISHYRAAVNDEDEMKETLIHMKSGDSFVASVTVKEFEKILNDHNGL